MRKNLLQETINILRKNGHDINDVHFVCDDKVSVKWDTFAIIADKYNYDSGYGGIEVNEQLRVVGDNWWLERHEYDGSEWWEYKTLPQCGELSDKIDVKYRFKFR